MLEKKILKKKFFFKCLKKKIKKNKCLKKKIKKKIFFEKN